MKSFLEFINEVQAPRSFDTMVPGSKSYVPTRGDRGIGDTVPNNTLTDESESGTKKIKKKK
jgi:hypothetical protein